jgi:hypothetical protein
MSTVAAGPEAGVDDPLAPFRRPGAPRAARPAGGQERPHGPPGYRAFGLARGPARPLRLEFRAATGLAVARAYTLLTEIAYDRDHYGLIILLFGQRKVTLHGRHLRPVVDALLAGTCEFITEIRDGEEAQEGAPAITRIVTAGSSGLPGHATAKPSTTKEGG